MFHIDVQSETHGFSTAFSCFFQSHAISRLILETLIFSSTIMRICPLVVLKTHFHLHFGFFCIFKKSKETISSAKKHSFSYVFYSCNVKRVSVCAIPITKTCCFFLFFFFSLNCHHTVCRISQRTCPWT